MSGSASVNVSTIDLSTRVPAFPGVFGGIVIPAKKGPLNQAVLVTNESQFLRVFTPDERVEVGYDLSYYSAIAYLSKSDKLWAVRVANSAYFAGASFKRVDSTTLNQALPSDQQLADPSAYLFDSNPDVPDAMESVQFDTVADVVTPAIAEVVSITTVADTAGSLDGLFFTLYDDAGSVAFWFDVDNSGTTAPAGALSADRNVEISTVNSNDDEFAVAQAIQAVIDGDSAFGASVASNVVTVTYAVGGVRTDATAGDSGFTVNVTTQGVDAISSLHQKYFVIYDQAGSVGVWFDVGNQGASAPAGVGALDRAIAVTTIVAGDDAPTVATKIASAVNADAQFSSSASTNELVITDANAGERTDATVGTSGFSLQILVQGSSLVNNVDEIFLIHSANEGAWGNAISIKIVNFSEDPENIFDNESFRIEVYKGTNLATPVETFEVSRKQGKLDGFGRNMYIEEVLQASEYINAVDNTAVDDSIIPLSQATPLAMNGGDDGVAVTDSEMQIGADALSNADDLLVTVLMDGGRTSVPYQRYLDGICQNRKDCVAVLSVPFAKEASASYLTDIIDYRRTELNLNSSFSALYTPHVSIFDKFNDRNIYVSPDGYAAGAISETASNFEIWFPPAGLRRGLINVLDVRRRFTKGERDALYNAGINPIKFAPGQGIAIWGQKTLSSRPSALDRLNVRLLLIAIQPAIAKALEDFLFELNDEATRSIARGRVQSFMDNIQGRRGVTEFLVVADSSNNSAEDIDNYRMNLDLYIKPTRSLEFINFRTIIVSTGDSFESVQL
jgi:phage tail sheath protein FI